MRAAESDASNNLHSSGREAPRTRRVERKMEEVLVYIWASKSHLVSGFIGVVEGAEEKA